ncbi:hypothetical protein H5410_027618, partial [Solanum commersonii]
MQKVVDEQGLSPRGTILLSPALHKLNDYAQSICNDNGKIWVFWKNDIDCVLLRSDDQHMTCEFRHVECAELFIIFFIYAKCRYNLRAPLWNTLRHRSTTTSLWCTVGDFNVVTTLEEKLG